jgi:pyridoxamine 5'-phosphate oxidase
MTPRKNSLQPIGPLSSSPFKLLSHWLEAARALGETPYPEAMTLATADAQGRPSARVVLLRGLSARDGLHFFTNYQSRKGQELEENPWGALLFYWPGLKRQVRVEGKVHPLSALASDRYWKTRPEESRINAIASPQSQALPDRETLLERVKTVQATFPRGNPPRPRHWGGYTLDPQRFEFWTEGQFRLHERWCFEKKRPSRQSNRKTAIWVKSLLAP